MSAMLEAWAPGLWVKKRVVGQLPQAFLMEMCYRTGNMMVMRGGKMAHEQNDPNLEEAG